MDRGNSKMITLKQTTTKDLDKMGHVGFPLNLPLAKSPVIPSLLQGKSKVHHDQWHVQERLRINEKNPG
jgi:hypothetical protein